MYFLTKNDILSDSQYGFREGISSSDALMDLTESISESLERFEKCAVVSIDLKKAFDTIHHDILFVKLEHYGIRGSAISVIYIIDYNLFTIKMNTQLLRL